MSERRLLLPRGEFCAILELMKENHLEPQINNEDEKTPMETVKENDSELREKAEKTFEDDEKFDALLESIKEYAAKTADENRTGIERARSLEALEAALEKVFQTKRGKISKEIIGISEKREKMEEEKRINNMAKKLARAEKKLEKLENE